MPGAAEGYCEWEFDRRKNCERPRLIPESTADVGRCGDAYRDSWSTEARCSLFLSDEDFGGGVAAVLTSSGGFPTFEKASCEPSYFKSSGGVWRKSCGGCVSVGVKGSLAASLPVSSSSSSGIGLCRSIGRPSGDCSLLAEGGVEPI